MIIITSAFNPKACANAIAKAGFTFNTTTVAAYIRHNNTNYDSVCNLLGTDEAEALIVATFKAVVSVAPMTKSAMTVWAQKKIKTLA